MSIASTLQKSSLFQGAGPDIAEELAQQCRQKDIPKGQQLFAAGDRADAFFMILTGWIKLFRVSRDGEEIIINIFGPGESFAEAAVFRSQRTYPVNAQAVANTQIIEIPRSFFVKKIEEDSQFALRILASISSHQHYLVQQIEQVTIRTAPQRIGAFLLQFCRKKDAVGGGWVVELPYDKSLISTRLNIKPETFSRALAKLEPYGVEIQGRDFRIHDSQKLAKFCDVQFQDTPC